ncbi:hypothetical protein MPOCJGCO_2037 [Methylobacterium trifolii]|uniref:Uncharacterized protein n=1 Tax=Methylobacterium trifolii TaxID=1003092 RepID=A0ABQ4U265_9HYPH|nr:hypothetical protein MPOCJGCO_2037 [Methylobacterium trifolii]
MHISKSALAVVGAALLMFVPMMPRASAGALDGLAGAAVGFALGAMVAGPRPGYYAPRSRRVAVYRSRPVRRHYAAAPGRRRAGSGGVAVNAASDPFANSAPARPIPVSGR